MDTIDSSPIVTEPPPLPWVDVETALARALEAAARAGRFDVVAQLARELEARRLAQSDGKVVVMDRERRP